MRRGVQAGEAREGTPRRARQARDAEGTERPSVTGAEIERTKCRNNFPIRTVVRFQSFPLLAPGRGAPAADPGKPVPTWAPASSDQWPVFAQEPRLSRQ